jgi:hypothetical protein
MTPNQIMIGNYLRWEDESNDIVVVSGIMFDSKLLDWCIEYQEIKKNGQKGNALLSEFIPIELTEEILLKAGFEGKIKPEANISWWEKNYFKLTCDEGEITYNRYYLLNGEWENDIIILKYVHKLQNLWLDFTDEDLEISLI